jgi:uncharacterized protein
MSFDRFGIVSHTQESKAGEFVKYLEQGKVMATRCKGCGTGYFPPQVDCPKCVKSDVEWSEVSGTGKLLTYSVINYGPQGFEDKSPYTLGVGDFGGGLKVFGMLSRDIKTSEVEVGMSLKVVPVKLPGDRYAFEFKTP